MSNPAATSETFDYPARLSSRIATLGENPVGGFPPAARSGLGARNGTDIWIGAAAVPNAPSSLSASVAENSVTLQWTAPPSGDPPTSYAIEAGIGPGRTDVSLDTGSAATVLNVPNVPPGTYYVRVRAKNSQGTSALSSNEITVTVTTGAPPPCAGAGPPGAPTGLTASVGGSTVTLNWIRPTTGCTPTGYVIEAGFSPGSSNLATFPTGRTDTSFTAPGVPAGTYYIRVRAANGNVNGPVSNEVTAIVGSTLPPPPPVVRGTVLDFQTHTPISGAVVRLGPDPFAGGTDTITDANGRYSLPQPQTTGMRYYFDINNSFAGQGYPVGTNYRGDLLLDTGTCVSRYGVVIDARTLQPIAAASVGFGNPLATTSTDGWYRIDWGCPASGVVGFNTTVLTASHPSYRSQDQVLGRGIARVLRLDFLLEPT